MVFLDRMGQNISTPLNLTLKHWAEVKARAHILSVDVKKQKWETLCASEWPTFQIGWPANGSFSLTLVTAIKQCVFGVGSKSYPDKIQYILVWEDLVPDPPQWSHPFVPFSGPAGVPDFTLQDHSRKNVLPDTGTELLLQGAPPPCPPSLQPPVAPVVGPQAELPAGPSAPQEEVRETENTPSGPETPDQGTHS